MPFKDLTVNLKVGTWTLADGKFFREYTGFNPAQLSPEALMADGAVIVGLLWIGSRPSNPKLRMAELESLTYDEVQPILEAVLDKLMEEKDAETDEEPEELELPPTIPGTSPVPPSE